MGVADDHPDPRMRKLSRDLTDIDRRSEALEEWSGRTSTSGAGKTDSERARYHRDRAQIVNEKLATVEAIQKVDPSFRPYDTKVVIQQLKDEKRAHDY